MAVWAIFRDGNHSLSIGYAVDMGLALTQVTKGRDKQHFHVSMDGRTRVWLLLSLLREPGSPEVLRGQRWAGIYVTGAPAMTSWQAPGSKRKRVEGEIHGELSQTPCNVFPIQPRSLR